MPSNGAVVLVQNADFGAREVVLRQLRDGVEQGRARSVVEELRCDPFARRTQTTQHFAGHVRPLGFAVEQFETRRSSGAGFGVLQVATIDFASRMPVNCQRSFG